MDALLVDGEVKGADVAVNFLFACSSCRRGSEAQEEDAGGQGCTLQAGEAAAAAAATSRSDSRASRLRSPRATPGD